MATKVYKAPINKKVYRAEKKGLKGNWFAFSKDDALGYANYGYKIVTKSIGGKSFLYATELEYDGFYYDMIIKNFSNLFKKKKGIMFNNYELKVSESEFWLKISDFLKKEGYDGIFTGKKLSIDYEVFIY